MPNLQPLSEAEEAELRKVVEGMTAGPWEISGSRIRAPIEPMCAVVYGWRDQQDTDAAGIVALRNNAERLLAAIKHERESAKDLFRLLNQTYEECLTPIAKMFGFDGPELDDSFIDFMKEQAATIANLRTVAEDAEKFAAWVRDVAQGDDGDWFDVRERAEAFIAKVRTS